MVVGQIITVGLRGFTLRGAADDMGFLGLFPIAFLDDVGVLWVPGRFVFTLVDWSKSSSFSSSYSVSS
jgi:hypothetical protein